MAAEAIIIRFRCMIMDFLFYYQKQCLPLASICYNDAAES